MVDVLPINVDYPTRPQIAKGFQAKPVKLVSNHFNLSLSKNQQFIYLYALRIIRDKDNSELPEDDRSRIFRMLNSIRAQLDTIYGKGAWNSGKVIWALKNVTKPMTFQITYEQEKYTIFIDKKKDITMAPEALNDPDLAAQVRQYVNVLVKRYFKLNGYTEWGMNSKYYDPESRADLNEFYIPL